MISAERLHALLDYDPATGAFRWKPRGDRSPWWNGRYAGQPAGWLCGNGYVGISIDWRKYYAHRLAWIMAVGDIPPGMQIDHVDRDKTNNRLSNLRLATRAQNSANSLHKSASGIKGAAWRADRGKWQAHITIDGRAINLGYFATPEEAHAAYLRRAQAQHGGFARGA